MPVESYSRTPSSNNSAPPNGWPEAMAPSAINDCARQMQTDIVNEAAKNKCKVLASVAGTNTITGSLSPALDAYSAGMLVVFTPANSNTGAATLNVDSLGALDVQKYDGEALAAGDLVAGIPAALVLDSGADDFILLNPQSQITTSPNVSAAEFGYKGVPQTSQGSYTYALTDAGKNVSPTSTGLTHTIPANATVAFPIGTVIAAFNNSGGDLTIAPAVGVTLYLSGTTSTGNRTLAHRGQAALMKLASDIWSISGAGVS